MGCWFIWDGCRVDLLKKKVYNELMNNFLERIEIKPGVRSGKPCIKGTRMTVYDILEYLARW